MNVLFDVTISGLIWGSIYALISMGLAVIWGVMDIVNFAHGDFLMVAMYVAYSVYLVMGLDPIFSIPIAGVVLFILGILTYKLVIKRIQSDNLLIQIVATFAVAILLRNIMQILFGTDYILISEDKQNFLTGKLDILGMHLNVSQLTAAVISLITAGAFYWFVKKTETGWSLMAVAENPYAAKLMGINIERVNMLAWGIGIGIVGISGALLAKFYYIFPTSGVSFGVLAFVIVALGGFRSIPGAFYAGIIVGVVESLAGYLGDPAYKVAVIFVLYILVMMWRPKGLLGT
jgi:branched-chain amino acid transport system permease protein